MTKDELLTKLQDLRFKGIALAYDPEDSHAAADKLLLDYINDEQIADAYNNIEKWYA